VAFSRCCCPCCCCARFFFSSSSLSTDTDVSNLYREVDWIATSPFPPWFSPCRLFLLFNHLSWGGVWCWGAKAIDFDERTFEDFMERTREQNRRSVEKKKIWSKQDAKPRRSTLITVIIKVSQYFHPKLRFLEALTSVPSVSLPLSLF
jgi:hypothetical protein